MLSAVYLVVILSGVLLSSVLAQPNPGSINWCQVKDQYCYGNEEHIGCEPNSFPVDPTCSNPTIVPLTPEMKDLLIRRHNEYRQHIANGCNSKFPSAKKMPVMEWDDSLAYLAEKHLEHCSFEHDQCHNTPSYPNSGQNLFYKGTAMVTPNATQALEEGMEAWFEEWKLNLTPNIINSLAWDDYSAFHFTVMVNDQNANLGCALLQYNFDWGSWTFDGFMLNCNYGYTNFIGQKVYTSGTPCSECTCSQEYPALCA